MTHGETGLPPYAALVGDAIELRLKVVPGASRSAVVGVLGGRLKVKVAAPPEAGQANRAVIGLLEAILPGASVTLVSGSTHAEKLVAVRGIAATRLIALLEPG